MAMLGIDNILKRSGILIMMAIMALSCREDKLEPVFYGSIEGQVLNADDNTPILNASVTTNPSTEALLSDASGKFSISDIQTGTYAVLAKKEGYGSQSVSITVNENKIASVSILMSKTDNDIDVSRPNSPDPADESIDRNNILDLIWIAPEIAGETDLLYTVLLYEEGNLNKNEVAVEISDTIVKNVKVTYETTYFWQVNTKLSSGDILYGEVWSFKTKDLPENGYLFSSTRDGNYEIYSTDSSGNDEFKLTNDFARDWNPLWSPTKDVIAYTSNRTETYIYTMRPNGTDSKKITPIPVVGYHNNGTGFSWSPGAGHLVFPHYQYLYRIDKNGFNLTYLATAPADRHFRQSDWTSQGDKIVVETVSSIVYNSEFYIMNSNGSGMKRLIGDWPGNLRSPTFSIDGQKILFTHDASGFESPDGRQLNQRIYIMNISDTTDIIDVSVNKVDGTNDMQPRFSPDGAKVIFVNQSNTGSGDKDVYVMDLDGSNRQLLFEDAEMPDWK